MVVRPLLLTTTYLLADKRRSASMPRAAVDGDDRPFHPPANGLNWGFAPMGVSSVCAVHHAACFASNSAHVAGRPPGLLARAGLRVCTLFRVTSEGSSPPGAMDKPVLSYAQTGDLLSQGLMLRCTERMIVSVARRTERASQGILYTWRSDRVAAHGSCADPNALRDTSPIRPCYRLSFACY